MNPISRIIRYAMSNMFPHIHYEKLFKKEYLPSRIRYSQFVFYVALAGLFYIDYPSVRHFLIYSTVVVFHER